MVNPLSSIGWPLVLERTASEFCTFRIALPRLIPSTVFIDWDVVPSKKIWQGLEDWLAGLKSTWLLEIVKSPAILISPTPACSVGVLLPEPAKDRSLLIVSGWLPRSRIGLPEPVPSDIRVRSTISVTLPIPLTVAFPLPDPARISIFPTCVRSAADACKVTSCEPAAQTVKVLTTFKSALSSCKVKSE